MHLEGDEAYRCWEALFEFEDIKVPFPILLAMVMIWTPFLAELKSFSCSTLNCLIRVPLHSQEAYQGECDTATGDNRASACRPLERFQNLVRQSGRYLQPLNLVEALPDISETFLIHSLLFLFLFLTSGYFFFECFDRHCSRIFHFSKNRSLTLKQQDQLFF
jgi:hypothetical protein